MQMPSSSARSFVRGPLFLPPTNRRLLEREQGGVPGRGVRTNVQLNGAGPARQRGAVGGALWTKGRLRASREQKAGRAIAGLAQDHATENVCFNGSLGGAVDQKS